MNDLDLWDFLILGTRTLLYLASIGAIGGIFSLFFLERHPDPQRMRTRYVRWCALTGLLVVIIHVFVQTADFSGGRVEGLYDWDMLMIVMDTSIGSSSAMRLLGFSFVLIASSNWFLARSVARSSVRSALLVVGAGTLAMSFLMLGHFSQASALYRVLLFLHILTLSFWVGLLFPLWHLNGTSESKEAQSAMRRFGLVAMALVAALMLCGVSLANALLDSWHQLLDSNYGRGMLLKVFLVCLLLTLAAINKIFLTPRLNQRGFGAKLSLAIATEMGLAVAIVVVTATITGIFGIDSRI